MSDNAAQADGIRNQIKNFILEEFLQGASADELKNDTALMSSGILDSLATVRLVASLEERYGIRIAPHEVSVDYLDDLDAITELVLSKQG
ncbi:MAG: acyl carrier protein [Gemmatimonadota bacterium]|nr:acyl carrier protein [Gemmatimonadota bacterium]MDH3422704.1 acyl carrier protein [Gemmatimonadota bacterium]